jgi:hypothetical protein
VTDQEQARQRRVRGHVSLYWLAFVLMLAAGAALGLAVKSFLSDLWPLWLSAGLSAAAVVFAVLGLALPRRR